MSSLSQIVNFSSRGNSSVMKKDEEDNGLIPFAQ